MMHRHPAVGSPVSASMREPGLPPPPLLPFCDFAFSSSSMTSWGLTLMCTTFGAESLNRQSGCWLDVFPEMFVQVQVLHTF